MQLPAVVVAKRPQDPRRRLAVEGADLDDRLRPGVPQQQVSDLRFDVVELGFHRCVVAPQPALLVAHPVEVRAVFPVQVGDEVGGDLLHLQLRSGRWC